MGGPEDRYTKDTMNYTKDYTPFRPGIDLVVGVANDQKATSYDTMTFKEYNELRKRSRVVGCSDYRGRRISQETWGCMFVACVAFMMGVMVAWLSVR